tara:strand:+ start:398 stop:622 length:225 start_codon:yes stop_codon:yes gene_type:complete
MRYTKKENEEWQGKNEGRTRFVTYYAYKEGVFPSPANNGKYVARVRVGKGKTFNTISQHDTIEEAQKAYDAYYS